MAAENTPQENAFDVHALPGGLPAAIEAILMVTDQPVSSTRLATALAVTVPEVETALGELTAELDAAASGKVRGYELRQAAGGWRYYSNPVFHTAVERFITDGQNARLTQAALETLAVIAYRQPVSRGQVSAVRGVNVDGVVRTLMTRGLIEEVATDESSGAILYGTSTEFLEKMGLNSVEELPDLAPHLPDLDELDGYGDNTRMEDATQ